MDRLTVETSTILRGLVDSTVHGLNVNDGIEDRDEMGVCVETFESAMTLGTPFEQFIYRSAAEREGRADAAGAEGQSDGPAAPVHARRSARLLRHPGLRAARADTRDRVAPGPGAVPRLSPRAEGAPLGPARAETHPS